MPENDEIPVFQVILTASASVTQADGATAADNTTQEG
jgi:hypothetical protein